MASCMRGKGGSGCSGDRVLVMGAVFSHYSGARVVTVGVADFGMIIAVDSAVMVVVVGRTMAIVVTVVRAMVGRVSRFCSHS